MKKLKLSKLVESHGILTGGFTTLTPEQQAKLKGGGDNCDCKNTAKGCGSKPEEVDQ